MWYMSADSSGNGYRCFIVVWWIVEMEGSFIHIVAPVPFAEETRLNMLQPNPNRFRGPAI